MKFFKRLKRNGWTALKVSAGNISFVHVKRRAGTLPVISVWVSQALNLDAAKAVNAFASEHNLNTRHCVAVLNRSEYQILKVDAVNVPAVEAKQAVRWSIKDMLDYPVDTASVDVLTIPFDSVNPSQPRFMLAIASRNEVIRQYIARFIDNVSTGLEAISIAETGQRNIAALLEEDDRGLALLSFNEEGGLLTFTAGGELYHSRQFSITAEQLQTKDEDILADIYARVALDLQRTLDNFERQFSYITVSRLLMAPFGMRSGLVDFLKSYLTLQIDTFELSDIFNVEGVPQLADVAMQSRAFTLLGVALREERA